MMMGQAKVGEAGEWVDIPSDPFYAHVLRTELQDKARAAGTNVYFRLLAPNQRRNPVNIPIESTFGAAQGRHTVHGTQISAEQISRAFGVDSGPGPRETKPTDVLLQLNEENIKAASGLLDRLCQVSNRLTGSLNPNSEGKPSPQPAGALFVLQQQAADLKGLLNEISAVVGDLERV